MKRFKIKTKDNFIFSHFWMKARGGGGGEGGGGGGGGGGFSLDFSAFGPSVLVGPRSKVDLRYKGYAWISILWSFDNSKRYGSSPTWFILWIRAILMDGDLLSPGWLCFRSQNI